MAITFPITGVQGKFTGGVSPSFTLGTVPQEHDIIVAYASSSTETSITDPPGWTNVLGENGKVLPADTSNIAAMLYHRVTAAEVAASTVTWTFTNFYPTSNRNVVSAVVLRGVALTGELVGVSSASDINPATPWIIPSVTPTADDCQVIAGVSADYFVGTPNTQAAAPWQWTTRVGSADTLSNYVYSRDTLGVDGVATGAESVTPNTADEYCSIVACFAPATTVTTTGTASGTISIVGTAVGATESKLFYGSTPVDAVYVGEDLVSRIYYGDVLVFSA